MLTATGLTVRYGTRQVLHDIDVTVTAGELLTVLGDTEAVTSS